MEWQYTYNNKVYATDYKRYDTWKDLESEHGYLKFTIADISEINSFPVAKASIVFCHSISS